MRRWIESLRSFAVALGVVALSGPVAGQDGFPAVRCPPGVAASPSGDAVRAQRSLMLGRGAEAMTGALAATQAQPANPHHQFVLARAAAATTDYEAAATAFDRATALCPAFAAHVDPERRLAFAAAVRQGVEAYQINDTAGAVARWDAANRLLPGQAHAWFNLGVVHMQRGDVAQASRAYRETLAALSTMPPDTSAEEMQSRVESRTAALAGLVQLGAQLFNRGDIRAANETFAFVTTHDPNNRDAWYNYALGLYQLAAWTDLIPVAQRLTRIDPLNYNARVILYNAFKGIADANPDGSVLKTESGDRALATLAAAEALPVYVDEIAISTPAAGGARGTGKITGNAAPAGRELSLEFTFWGAAGQIGSANVPVRAPAKGQSTTFEIVPPAGAITSWSYSFR